MNGLIKIIFFCLDEDFFKNFMFFYKLSQSKLHSTYSMLNISTGIITNNFINIY